MQVYRGLNIGTAKLSPAESARVPHHLIDVTDLDEPFDAAKFSTRARQAVSEIQSRNHWPILCGGTGLYFNAFLDGLGDAPPANPDLRRELEALPMPDLLRELAERDPVTYERIDRNNSRRVVRAVEVIRLTGRPFSEQRADWLQSSVMERGGMHCFGLARAKADLLHRIDARVEEMFRRGLVAETAQLLQHGLEQNPAAMQALGYRQVCEHLSGKRSLPETIELVKIRTRQFAKRQITWFQRQMRLDWLYIEPFETAQSVAGRLAAAARIL